MKLLKTRSARGSPGMLSWAGSSACWVHYSTQVSAKHWPTPSFGPSAYKSRAFSSSMGPKEPRGTQALRFPVVLNGWHCDVGASANLSMQARADIRSRYLQFSAALVDVTYGMVGTSFSVAKDSLEALSTLPVSETRGVTTVAKHGVAIIGALFSTCALVPLEVD